MKTAIAVTVLAVGVALLLVPFHPEAPLLWALDHVTPHTAAQHDVNWFVVETGGNFLLFAVIGAAATLLTGRAGLGATIGVAVSAFAEIAQLVVPNRVASVSDLVVNSLGAVAGAAAFWAARRLRARATAGARRADPA